MDDVLDLLFDQYSRYRACADLLTRMGANETTRVLDVGSGVDCLLGRFLPHVNLTYVDPLLVHVPNRAGNQRAIPLSQIDDGLGQFDFVVSIDVFEHIPPEERGAFIETMVKMAARAVVLAFPNCDEPHPRRVDQAINANYRHAFGREYPWLAEHNEYGLPSVGAVRAQLQAAGFNVGTFAHAHAPWLIELLSVVIGAWDIPDAREVALTASREFNRRFFQYDYAPPGYRTFIVGVAGDWLPSYVPEIIPIDANTAVEFDSFVERVYRDLLPVVARISMARDAAVAEVEAHLVALRAVEMNWEVRLKKILQERFGPRLELERDWKIEDLNQAVADRDTQIAHMTGVVIDRDTKIATLDQSLTERDTRINELSQQMEAARQENIKLREQLVHEQYTVVRPIFRKALRSAKIFARSLPQTYRTSLRMVFYEAISRFAPHSSLAHQYRDFKRARGAGRTINLPVGKVFQQDESDGQIEAARKRQDGRPDIFIFPIIDWHFRIQRAQHIAAELARLGHRVFYFTTGFLTADGPAFRVLELPVDGVFICQLACSDPHPVIYSDPLGPVQQRRLSDALVHFRQAVGIRPAVALVHLPFWLPLARTLAGAPLVYDCMDYHAGFNNVSSDVIQREEELLRAADLVITSSRALSEHVGEVVSNVLIRNAADVDFFQQSPARLAWHSKNPTVGYFGAIADWFDTALVHSAALAYPNWDFVLIGSCAFADTSQLETRPNVHFMGEVPYQELPSYLYAFDVCIIPFRLNELILHTNPVKLYEYLSAGKPVVATALPELLALPSGVVRIASTEAEFIAGLSAAMEESKDQGARQRRSDWAKQHTWVKRAAQFDEALRSCFPKVSVIVLCYNKLDFTKACLESLERHTAYPNWELIIVDNASADGTGTYVTEYATTRPWVHAIVNTENRGFAGGNNVGLNAATGDYLVILNNDTYVTAGWLGDLIRPLRKDQGLGLVGPVTNNIGNEAKIDLVYETMEQMADNARRYTMAHCRELLYVENVAFFCTAMPRRVYEQVGPLDESFKIGFFEDDDYCRRVRMVGYRIAIAEDVFIHHHLSASFNALGEKRKQEIFEESRRIYEAKWGVWQPHRYRAQ